MSSLVNLAFLYDAIMDRKEILKNLIDERFAGNQADFARAIGKSPAQVNQWIRGIRNFGGASARHTEMKLGLCQGYFDGARKIQSSVEPVEPGHDFVPVSRVLLRLEAGVTGYHVQQLEGNGPPIFFRRDYLESRGWRSDRLFAMKVMGDSMEPSLFDGDLVVINSADTEPIDGEVFAVNYEGQAVIKRLRRDSGEWWLDSDNTRHKPKRCDEHAIIVGKVCYKQSEKI